MALPQKSSFRYVPDKCNPPVDMGSSILFASPLPGLNNTVNRPFGWTEYEAAYRPQYVPDPCAARQPCVDPCRPKGVDRKPNPRQFINPQAKYLRSTICDLCHKARCCCPIPPPWEECKEKVVVYEPDSVRTLLVHGEVKNEHPFVLSNQEYYKILNSAIVPTKEEKAEQIQKALREKQMRIDTCREKADDMRLMDKYRFNASISPEAQEDMEEIMCRADKILKEDEPEVRAINSVILSAKVSAIREAQLQEKELMRCEEAEENRRLDGLMEQDKGHVLIKDDAEELEKIEQKKRNLMASLKAQLDEHEAMKFYMQELKENEWEEMRRMWEQFDMEEIKKKNLDREKKARMGLELLENQMLTMERMRFEKEMDKELDQKMIDWQKKKAAEEEAFEKEKAYQKRLKDISIMKILEGQKKTSDAKSIRDELRARRHQEQQEREWRRKEQEAAMKRKKDGEELKAAILNQIDSKHNWLADQAAYDKAVYDKILNQEDGRMKEELEAAENKKIRNAVYSYDLREQIHQFQMDKIKERKDYFIEGIKLRRQLGARETELKCFMQDKLDELRESKMPEKYLRYIKHAVDQELQPDWKKKIR